MTKYEFQNRSWSAKYAFKFTHVYSPNFSTRLKVNKIELSIELLV